MKLIDAMLLVSFFCCFTFYLIFIIPFWCVQTSVKYLTPDIPLVFGIRSIQATANCMLFLHQACNVCVCSFFIPYQIFGPCCSVHAKIKQDITWSNSVRFLHVKTYNYNNVLQIASDKCNCVCLFIGSLNVFCSGRLQTIKWYSIFIWAVKMFTDWNA